MIGAMEILSLIIIFIIVYFLGNNAPKTAKKMGEGIRKIQETKELKNKIKQEIDEIKLK